MERIGERKQNWNEEKILYENDKHGTLFFIETVIARIIIMTITQHAMIVAS